MVGDLVLVADKESARGTWPVGQITKVMPGKDGVVRTAIVQTQYGEYFRPANAPSTSIQESKSKK